MIKKEELIAVKTALSIKQPWAWLIANGYKRVENRTWDTRFRGWFYIHAGKKVDEEGYSWVSHNIHVPLPPIYKLQTGGIVGVARVTGVTTQSDNDPWFFGPYGFTLANAEATRLHPLRGQLGFFRVDLSQEVIDNLLICDVK